MKLIRSDGNGGYIVSRGFMLAISIITLCSMVWGVSTAYTTQVRVGPFEARVVRLEKLNEDRAVYIADINRKLDLIMYRLEVENTPKKGGENAN